MASPTPVLPEVGSTIVPPGCSSPRGLGGVDHPRRDPVLHRAAGVEVLHLGEHQRARSAPPRAGRACRAAAPAGCCRRGRAATPRSPWPVNIAAVRRLVSHRREWPRGRRQPRQPYGAGRRAAPRRAPAARGTESILDDPLAVRVTGDDPDDLVARARERGDHRMRLVRVRPQPVRRGGAGRRRRRRGRPARRPRRGPRHLRLPQPVRRAAASSRSTIRPPRPGSSSAWTSAGIAVPEHRRPRGRRLRAAGPRSRCSAGAVDLDRPVLFWWLGVTPYLTGPAVETTLSRAGLAALVGGRARPRDPARRRRAEPTALMRRRREAVARLGEPWVSAYAYPELAEVAAPVRLHRGEAGGRGCDDPPLPGPDAPRRQGPPRPSHLVLATRGWPRRPVSRGRSGWSARAAG